LGWPRPAGRGALAAAVRRRSGGFRALSDIYIGGQARRFRRLPLAKSAAIRPRTLQVIEAEFGVKVLDTQIHERDVHSFEKLQSASTAKREDGPVTAKLCNLAIWKLPAISRGGGSGDGSNFLQNTHFVKSQGSGFRKMHPSPIPLGQGRTGEMSKVAPILARIYHRPASQTRERGIFARWAPRLVQYGRASGAWALPLGCRPAGRLFT